MKKHVEFSMAEVEEIIRQAFFLSNGSEQGWREMDPTQKGLAVIGASQVLRAVQLMGWRMVPPLKAVSK